MRMKSSGTLLAVLAAFLPGTLWCQDLPLFQDVPATSPYYHHVNLLAERMITLGCSAEPALYCGEYPSVLTRGQAAVLVIRSIYSARTGDGENFAYPSTPYFADVPAEHGQFKYIQKMKELGITSGCAVGTTYCPEDSTNFGQIAVFTYRARQIRYGQSITPPAACTWDPFWDVPASHAFCPYIRDVYYNYLGFSAISPSCYTGFCPDMTMPRGIMAIYLTAGVMAATQSQYLADSAGQLPPVVVNGANPCPAQIDLYTNNRIDPIGSQWFAIADTFVALRGSPTPITNTGLWTYTTSESFTTGGGQQLFVGTLSSKSASQVTVTSPPFSLNGSQDNLNSATHQYYSACLPNGRARYFTSNAPQIFSVNPVVLFRGTSQTLQFRGSQLQRTLRAVSPNTSITTHSLSNQTYQTVITVTTPASAPVGVIGLGLVSTAWDGVHEVSTATMDVTVADPTPVLNPLSQSSGAQGTNLSLTLTGANFGANPTVCILVNGNCLTSTGGVTITRGYCGYTCSTQIPVTISIDSSAAPGTLNISVVSTGAIGMGFAPAPNGGSQAQSNVQPFQVQPSNNISMDGIQVTQAATPSATDGTLPTVSPFVTSNSNSQFASANSPDLLSVLMNSGTISVTGQNIQPAESVSTIRWALEKDPSDTVSTDGATPIVLSSPVGSQTSFAPSMAGNFRLIAYVDTNQNGSFNEGEQLRILRIAIVRMTLLDSTFSLRNTFEGTNSAQITSPLEPDLAPMSLFANYLMEGGGTTRTIGTSAVMVGNVGNLLYDNFTVAYDPSGTGIELPGGPTPMVDTGRVQVGQETSGGDTAFRSSSLTVDQPAQSGRVLRLLSGDAPKFAWRLFLENNATWASTSGGLAFREFVVAFTSNFPKTYVPFHWAEWTVNLPGVNDSGWEASELSGVVGSEALVQVSSQTLQVRGRSFAKQNQMTYSVQ